jgi:uncharacterized protein YvpB
MSAVVIRGMLLIVIFGVVIAWYFIPDRYFAAYMDTKEAVVAPVEDVSNDVLTEIEEEDVVAEKDVVVDVVQEPMQKRINQSVVFTSQAPHAQWDDPRYQDACEEASMVMAYAWLTDNDHLSKNDAEKEIEKIFQAQKELFGDVVDTSAMDTALFFESYYQKKALLKKDVTLDEMYELLSAGNIIIAPTNGKMLQNPNFTNGGPERHMLVITGYDKDNREFITNDPGTRLGRGYKYKDSTLFNAIRDYATGNKLPIRDTQKNIIVISK